MGLTHIQTYTGKLIDPFNLKMDDIDIRDIAHALSQMPRFAGHLEDFYSVGLHSIRCCALAARPQAQSQDIILEMLLHDASEAYLMDMPSPIKWRIEGYEQAERNICAAISNKFLLDFGSNHKRIKELDKLALQEELNALMYKNYPCEAWYINTRNIPMKNVEQDFLNIYAKWRRI